MPPACQLVFHVVGIIRLSGYSRDPGGSTEPSFWGERKGDSRRVVGSQDGQEACPAFNLFHFRIGDIGGPGLGRNDGFCFLPDRMLSKFRLFVSGPRSTMLTYEQRIRKEAARKPVEGLKPLNEVKVFDPAQVFRSKWLSPEELTFRVGVDSENRITDLFAFDKNGRSVFGVHIRQKSKSLFNLSSPAAEQNVRGKGLGTFVYLAMAKIIYRKRGSVLQSSYGAMSWYSIDLWKPLEEEGYAYQPTAGIWAFREDVLLSSLLDPSVDFLTQHVENPEALAGGS